jgi:hypothetical protein
MQDDHRAFAESMHHGGATLKFHLVFKTAFWRMRGYSQFISDEEDTYFLIDASTER